MNEIIISNELVEKYEPLVNKITKQFVDKVKVSWDDVKSMAYEGLAIAFNTYDSERSKMTFVQFAGFAIRNNILTGLNNELRTVKLSAYAQKKAVERGEAVFNSVSMDGLRKENPQESDCRESMGMASISISMPFDNLMFLSASLIIDKVLKPKKSILISPTLSTTWPSYSVTNTRLPDSRSSTVLSGANLVKSSAPMITPQACTPT